MGTALRGFTIIEILLALAIMVIASAIAVPCYDVYAERAEQTAAATDLMRIDMTIERFSSANFNFPDSLVDIVRAGNGSFFGVAEDF